MRKGELNKLVDILLHPYFRRHKSVIILDGVVHALIEQNPEQSLKKFIRYNLKYLTEVK